MSTIEKARNMVQSPDNWPWHDVKEVAEALIACASERDQANSDRDADLARVSGEQWTNGFVAALNSIKAAGGAATPNAAMLSALKAICNPNVITTSGFERELESVRTIAREALAKAPA